MQIQHSRRRTPQITHTLVNSTSKPSGRESFATRLGVRWNMRLRAETSDGERFVVILDEDEIELLHERLADARSRQGETYPDSTP